MLNNPVALGALELVLSHQPIAHPCIDGHLDITRQGTGKVTCRFLRVQVKICSSYFSEMCPGSWIDRVSVLTRRYWRENSFPVILVIMYHDAGIAIWSLVDDSDFPQLGPTPEITLPISQLVDESFAPALVKIFSQRKCFLGITIYLPKILVKKQTPLRISLSVINGT